MWGCVVALVAVGYRWDFIYDAGWVGWLGQCVVVVVWVGGRGGGRLVGAAVVGVACIRRSMLCDRVREGVGQC